MNENISACWSVFIYIPFFIFGCVQLGYFINYIGNNNVCQSTTVWLGVDAFCWLAYAIVIVFVDLMIILIANSETYGKLCKSIAHFVAIFAKILLMVIGTTLLLKCKKHNVSDYDNMIVASLVVEYLFAFCLLIAFAVRTCRK